MPQAPSPAVSVHRADGEVIVAVRGELGPLTASQARDRITGAIDSRPQRLVLNLLEVREGAGAECLALIAVTQYLLPAGCLLDVCTSDPAVQVMLALAGGSPPDPAARPCQGIGASSECVIHGLPREAIRCAGPIRLGGAG